MSGGTAMDQPGAAGPPDLKKDRSHAQGDQTAHPGDDPAPAATQDGPVPHGSSDAFRDGGLPNGAPRMNGGLPTANGGHAEAAGAVVAGPKSPPPPLDQTWRSTDHNKSLGRLMERMAQQCLFDLTDTLTKMSDLGGQPSEASGEVNGVVPAHAVLDTSPTSLEKKRLLMNFAHEQRDRFTKTLVISDWSRNAEDMAKLIDLKVWQDQQRFAAPNAARAIGETKRNTIAFRVPAPNIEGAMELLATGKANWVPDLGYIPPKRLTAKQLLKTLKDMNVTLATRLNLHEELPVYMSDFTIANGRATFRVPGEFEVDLSVADDDLATPFYFIDIRFLFSSSADVITDQLRAHLEGRVNRELAAKGLQGCYDFLHNFVLTHKVNVLRSQAADLIGYGKWFDCIKVEHMRRSLVVHYWAGIPGPKNWFEIGISSGKQKPSRRPPNPALSVRWFRKGREVVDEQLDIDWENLDLERILVNVIGRHCFGKLTTVRDGMNSMEPTSQALKAELTSRDNAPEESTLQLSLPSMRSPLCVRIEPVTGRFSISPPSASTIRCERVINADPNIDVSRLLASLLCQVMQTQIDRPAELLGWAKSPVALDKGLLTPDTQIHSIYSPAGWGQNWVLIVSFGLAGQAWWIGQVRKSPPRPGGHSVAAWDVFKTVRLLDAPDSARLPLSLDALSYIGIAAVARVSLTVLAAELQASHVPFHVEQPAPMDGTEATLQNGFYSVLFMRFTALLRDASRKPPTWAHDIMCLSHLGIELQPRRADPRTELVDQLADIKHELRLSLEPGKMTSLRQNFTNSRDQDIRINKTGGLALMIRTRFGEPFLEQIRTRLQNVAWLDRRLAILRRFKFTCTDVSLTRLHFTYSTSPPLSAQLLLAGDGSFPLKLGLEPAGTNPHQRIRVMLEQALNKSKPNAFYDFVYTLQFTLQLLQTFDRLETAHASKLTLAIRNRNATWYNVAYRPPLPPYTFDIRLRRKQQGSRYKIVWHMKRSRGDSTQQQPPQSPLPKELGIALGELWSSQDEHWMGIDLGLVADAEGIGLALEKLDGIMRRFEGPPEGPDPAPESASASVAPAPAPAPAPASRPPQQRKPSAQNSRKRPAGKDDVIQID